MKRISRLCIWVLILSVLNLQAAVTAFAIQKTQIAKLDSITKHPPEMVASPELNMPEEKLGEKKSYNWVWWVLGAVAVGAAAAGGGGGGGGGGDGGSTASGSVAVGW